jgi:tetratricopeptide (TPR) repeat protein
MAPLRCNAISGFVGMLICLLSLSACQQKPGSDAAPQTTAIFGNGYRINSPVICKVGDLEITQQDLELRYEDLPDAMKGRFSGVDWEKRLLRYMVDEALLARQALRLHLDRDPEVARNLISQRRAALKTALRSKGDIPLREPTEQEIREQYETNRTKYVMQGRIHARHLVCDTREAAYDLYGKLRETQDEKDWLMAVAKYSKNAQSAQQGGDLGWFDRGGIIPTITYGRDFAEIVWNWDIGLHEPVSIQGDWHIIEILDRETERPMTLEEARDMVITDLAPRIQDQQLDAYIRGLRGQTEISYFGAYARGQGKSAKELFERAWYASTAQEKVDIYSLILDDYPDDELIDETLFLLANVYYDNWGDVPAAMRLLDRLCQEHPESELYDDAEYIKQNLGKANYRRPLDIKDLQPSKVKD